MTPVADAAPRTALASVRDNVRRSRRAYQGLAPFARPYRRYLLEGAGATLLLVAARLAFPWPLRGLMDIVLRTGRGGNVGRGAVAARWVPHNVDPLWWFVGWFVVIIVVWGASEARQRLAYTRLAVGLVRDARDAALRNLPDINLADPGSVIATITGDAARVRTGVKSLLVGTTRNGAFFLGVAVIVGLIYPLVGLVFLGGGLGTALLGGLGAWRASHLARRSRRRESALTTDIYRYLNGETAAPLPDLAPRRAPDSKLMRIEGWTTFAIHLVLALTTCAILVLTVAAGRTGRLSSGSVFTVIAYVLLMHNKSVSVGRRVIRTAGLLASAERLGRQAAPRRSAAARCRSGPKSTEGVLSADPRTGTVASSG